MSYEALLVVSLLAQKNHTWPPLVFHSGSNWMCTWYIPQCTCQPSSTYVNSFINPWPALRYHISSLKGNFVVHNQLICTVTKSLSPTSTPYKLVHQATDDNTSNKDSHDLNFFYKTNVKSSFYTPIKVLSIWSWHSKMLLFLTITVSTKMIALKSFSVYKLNLNLILVIVISIVMLLSTFTHSCFCHPPQLCKFNYSAFPLQIIFVLFCMVCRGIQFVW